MTRNTAFYILTLFIYCITYSCTQSKSTSKLDEFNDFIGDYNFEITSALVKQMDSVLLAYYQTNNLKDAYRQYMEDIREGVTPSIHDCSACNRLESYYYSGMESKYIRYSYDSIVHTPEWNLIMRNGDTIKARKCGLLLEEIEVQGPGNHPKYERISITWALMPHALERLNLSDTIIIQYIRRIREVGSPHPSSLAMGILNNQIDLSSSYFRKLIVLREFYYPQLIEYGCVERIIDL